MLTLHRYRYGVGVRNTTPRIRKAGWHRRRGKITWRHHSPIYLIQLQIAKSIYLILAPNLRNIGAAIRLSYGYGTKARHKCSYTSLHTHMTVANRRLQHHACAGHTSFAPLMEQHCEPAYHNLTVIGHRVFKKKPNKGFLSKVSILLIDTGLSKVLWRAIDPSTNNIILSN